MKRRLIPTRHIINATRRGASVVWLDWRQLPTAAGGNLLENKHVQNTCRQLVGSASRGDV